MNPSRQLKISTILMGFGVLPLGLVVAWISAFFLTSVPGQAPRIAIIDPIGMVGLLLVSFIITCLVAGGSAIWSWVLVIKHKDIRSRRALVLRLVTALVIASPFLLAGALRIKHTIG